MPVGLPCLERGRPLKKAFTTIILPSDRYAKIYTDSQASLLALNTTTVTSKLVKSAILSLSSLSLLLSKLTITWIKAHIGHHGNERTDQLARSCSSFPISTSNFLPSPIIFKHHLWNSIYTLPGQMNGNNILTFGCQKTFSPTLPHLKAEFFYTYLEEKCVA